jgi:hypothetical protein
MRAFFLIVLTVFYATLACAADLPSFKDSLFAYPGILEQTDNGRRLVIDYNEMRDINGRDIEPERRVKRNYISQPAASKARR